MAQTTVNNIQPRALPGMIGDGGHGNYIKSYAAEGGVDFGLAVIGGTDPETQALVPTVGGTVVGFSVHQHPLEDETAANDLVDGETFGVMKQGRIWAVAAEAMAVGDTVYIEDAGGQVRNDITAATILNDASVESYDADTGLVLLSLLLK